MRAQSVRPAGIEYDGPSMLIEPEAPSLAYQTTVPPLPPEELRRLVCHEDFLFDLPTDGSLAFPYIADESLYQSVFDFGCGCGRIARQLLTQKVRPKRYVGIDIHLGMIAWCQRNLSTFDPGFKFYHHDVWNLGLAPENSRQSIAPFPVDSDEFSLVIAHSVFTHLYPAQTEHYLGEVSRILRGRGMARTTWFLFDRLTFPMMFEFQVALFINETDPSNAVIYEWRWLLDALKRCGLRILHTVPPATRGHQWELYLHKSESTEDLSHNFPSDPSTHRMFCGSGSSLDGGQPIPADSPVSDCMSSSTTTVSPQASLDSPGLPQPESFKRHLLRFSGDIDVEEFNKRCDELPWWYHSYYFENGFKTRGDYDIGADIDAYGFPESMEGMRVLDVGTGAGWFAFYFEQLGAQVVTVDARGYCDFDVYGRPFYLSIEKENRSPDRFEQEAPIYHSPVSRGFWIMKEILKSGAEFKNARVYDLNPEMFGGLKFDLVFLGALLCHLRDPIGALMAARRVCKHRVIASTPVILGETEPEALPRQYLPYTAVDKISWWLPNEACFRHWFLAAGFIGVDVSRQVNLRADIQRHEDGKWANGDQILRVGSAFVP